MEEKMIEILSEDISKKYGVNIKYVLFECKNPDCKRTWGTNLTWNWAKETQLVCSACALKEMTKDI
jgi:hypothetical protein